MNHLKVGVSGMHCASCAQIITKELQSDKNITEVNINPVSEEAEISSYGPLNTQLINKRLGKLGYQLIIPDNTANSVTAPLNSSDDPNQRLDNFRNVKLRELNIQKNKLKVVLPLMGVILIIMFWSLAADLFNFTPKMLVPENIMLPLVFLSATLVVFWIGIDFLKAVGRFVRFGKANMDTLIGLGTGTAYFYSTIIYLFPFVRTSLKLAESYFFDVSIVVIVLVYFGKYLESKAKLSTNETLDKLLALQTKTALVERNGREEEISLHDLKVSDIAIIKPGTKIPADGEVVSGFSAVDEALISGESIPVDKKPGDKVIGSTINRAGLLKIKITKIGQDTILATIIAAVAKAQNSRAPIQKLVDKVAGVFVPIVLVIALLTLAAWLIIAPRYLDWTTAVSLGITCFISILAIACPCALGLATPTGIMVGLGLASKNNLLIKNATSLEKFGKTKIVAFDKTGTITVGEPSVTDVIPFGLSRGELIQIAASLENNSEHPLAKALLNLAKEEKLILQATTNFISWPGKGLQAEIAKQNYWLGNIKLAQELKFNLPSLDIAPLEKQGKTIILLGNQENILGLIAVADKIKPEAPAAIQALKDLGIKTVMLSGDRQEVADYIAEQVGLDKVYGEVSPAAKADIITELKKEGVTAMLGDGVNDAIALVSADIGIAMSNGSDVAIESADITILNGDLSKLAKALKISRLTMSKIKQNLFWAFFYNIIAIPVAAGLLYPINGWLLSPMIAAGAMSLSSLSVIFNTLLMRRAKI